MKLQLYFLIFIGANAVCPNPLLREPEIKFGKTTAIETNKNFTFPEIYLTFDKAALNKWVLFKRFLFGAIRIIPLKYRWKKLRPFAYGLGADDIIFGISLVNEDDKIVRHVFSTEIAAVNGLYTSPVLVIPSYGLGQLPQHFRWKLSLRNRSRVHYCKFATAVSEPFLIKNGSGSIILKDELFPKKYSLLHTDEVIIIDGHNCTFVQYFGSQEYHSAECIDLLQRD